MNLIKNIPKSLAEVDQWNTWWQTEDGRKIPASPVDQPDSWLDFESAVKKYLDNLERWSGLAFFFHDSDPFTGIDLDNCLDEAGNPKPWARGIIERFSDTYAEISPSGRGTKIWCRGRLPNAVGKVVIESGGIELYDRARFFTVTGNVFRGAPLEVEDHTADVLALYERLTRGRHSGPQYEIGVDGKIPHGRQHLTLVSICGTLRRRGLCDEAIRACLQAVNRHQCERPGLPQNIDRIVRSSTRWRQPA